jgi:hypothetical protein
MFVRIPPHSFCAQHAEARPWAGVRRAKIRWVSRLAGMAEGIGGDGAHFNLRAVFLTIIFPLVELIELIER